MSTNLPPRVSLIVPSWTGEVTRLMDSVRAQTFQDYEVEVVRGISPAARARNVGAARSRGGILLFIDDDAYFGHPRVLETLVAVLDRDAATAVAGTSKLAPKDSTPLQQAIARQVPRTVYPVVPGDTESNPPLDEYGFTAITTTCCAVRRAVFEEVGGFDEGLTTGPEDTDFFFRVRRLGYRLVVAGGCWVYHDPPGSLRDLLRKSFWYGVGHALEARKNPERGMAVIPLHHWYGALMLLPAVVAFPFSFFANYYFDPTRRLVIGFRPLKALSTYAVLCGYVYGWYHGPPRRPATTYMGRKAAGGAGATNVLYVDAYPKIGGGQQVLYSLVTRLPPERYRPIVGLPPVSPLRARLAEAGIATTSLPFEAQNYTLPDWRRPDTVLNSFGSVVRVIQRIARAGRRHDVALIHANSVVAGVHALPAAMLLRVPCVVQAHDFLTAPATDATLKVMLRYQRAAMIFVSHALARHYGAGASYLYRVIHNGVDTTVFRPDPVARARIRAEFGRQMNPPMPDDCFLVGAVGRIERGKGFDVLIDAFAQVATAHPKARLVIVGDPAFAPGRAVAHELRTQVQRLGLESRVLFTGFRDNMPPIMAALDLLVHCPVAPEGFGLILAEAMACDCPVLTVPAGAIPEIVQDGVNGRLVPQGDRAALAAAMDALMSDPVEARRLAVAGRATVYERFTLQRATAQVEELYDTLLGHPAAEPSAVGAATEAEEPVSV